MNWRISQKIALRCAARIDTRPIPLRTRMSCIRFISRKWRGTEETYLVKPAKSWWAFVVACGRANKPRDRRVLRRLVSKLWAQSYKRSQIYNVDKKPTQ